ncbi:MAG TPA: prepilin-type N-terminal cleavage/methylation domain-containing protein [Candidatus Acidoferrum sp.]|nr:prepilin-type N-terminal cleavage/methylation domain-containing protein [Candidatus Acidoferrum sp.]
MSGRTQNGFSLIELLIVVAIILIIAGIAIPNLIQAKIAANQASAVQSLRTISSAAAEYSSSYQDGYPPSLAVLGSPAGIADCNAAGLIDAQLVAGAKSGYQFAWHVGADQVTGAAVPPGCAGGYLDMYSVTADPFGFPTGTTHYCVDANEVIRENTATIATTTANGCDPAAQAIGN